MTQQSTPPQSLLVHDGELVDFRTLLGELGTPFVECVGSPGPNEREGRWDLVIATPKRLLSLHLEDQTTQPARIAVCDQDSKTLRTSLERAGIETLVRRPVHPAAMRALLLHALYRGPEKRNNRRVSVGGPVRYRRGWRQRPAMLADLSLGGCRLLADQALERGQAFTLLVPPELSGGRGYSVRARVVRSVDIDDGPGGERFAIHARFEDPSRRQLEKLQASLRQHVAGPATLDDAREAAQAMLDENAAPEAHEAAPEARRANERRSEARHEIGERVVALDDEAARVLMGRDISLGGMRVDPNPRLVVGDNVRIAIHLEGHANPLVLHARVHRDDGARGIVLRFHELPREAARALTDLLDALPIVSIGASQQGGAIVSELLETGTG
jgi:hypothetical protein